MATDAQVSTGKALGIDVSAEPDSIAAAIICPGSHEVSIHACEG